MSNPATQTVTAKKSSNALGLTRAGDADVRAERREPVDGAEHEVHEPREALAERIDQHAERRDRQELHAERIEHPRREQRARPSPITIAHTITAGESAPVASARRAVRGLRASMSRSK